MTPGSERRQIADGAPRTADYAPWDAEGRRGFGGRAVRGGNAWPGGTRGGRDSRQRGRRHDELADLVGPLPREAEPARPGQEAHRDHGSSAALQRRLRLVRQGQGGRRRLGYVVGGRPLGAEVLQRGTDRLVRHQVVPGVEAAVLGGAGRAVLEGRLEPDGVSVRVVELADLLQPEVRQDQARLVPRAAQSVVQEEDRPREPADRPDGDGRPGDGSEEAVQHDHGRDRSARRRS